MRKRWEAMMIGGVWIVAAVVMAAPSGVVSLVDLLPIAPVMTAAEDGRINGTEWLKVLVSTAFMCVFLWRMVRHQAGQHAPTDEQA